MLSLRLHPAALAIGALFTLPVLAAPPEEGLHVYGGVGWAHDDNLFRVPENEPAFDNKRGDSWVQTEVGLIFDKTYSRQRIQAVGKLSKVKFDHFDQLDYDGKDMQATWHWQLGNRFEGKAGATYAQTLAPYTDFRSDQRNLRRQRRQFFEGTYKLHPSWRARAAVSRDKWTYELLAQRFNNRTEKTAELEAGYEARSGSSVGLVLRQIKGEYPFRRPVGPALLNNDFTQDELKLRVNWLAGGSTTIQALVGYAQREQPSFGEGKTSGANGRITALYTPRGKVSYKASVWRDFAPLESTVVSYTLNKGASIGATWDATAKVRVEADAIYEKRDYNPRLALLGASDLNDSIRSASVRATWAVKRKVQLSAGYQHQARSGSPVLGTGKFSANVVSINASAQF